MTKTSRGHCEISQPKLGVGSMINHSFGDPAACLYPMYAFRKPCAVVKKSVTKGRCDSESVSGLDFIISQAHVCSKPAKEQITTPLRKTLMPSCPLVSPLIPPLPLITNDQFKFFQQSSSPVSSCVVCSSPCDNSHCSTRLGRDARGSRSVGLTLSVDTAAKMLHWRQAELCMAVQPRV